MRVVLGLVGVLVSLPPVVLFWILSWTLTRATGRTIVRLLEVISGACLLVSAISILAPTLRRANLQALALMGLVYLAGARVTE